MPEKVCAEATSKEVRLATPASAAPALAALARYDAGLVALAVAYRDKDRAET